jgi:hypothetical protein
MKVIFLDHDGVICLASEFGSRFVKKKRDNISMVFNENGLDEFSMPVEYRFDNFNRKAVKVLNSILEETQAEIVVSSDWKKWASLEEMGEYYISKGIIKKPIGMTARLEDIDEYTAALFNYKGWYERSRILEIEHWLKNNPVDAWVAIDDMPLGEYENSDGSIRHGLKNFVQTPRINEGIKQSGIKEKIINLLK